MAALQDVLRLVSNTQSTQAAASSSDLAAKVRELDAVKELTQLCKTDAGEADVRVVRQRLERGKGRHLAIGPSVGVATPARLPKPNDKSKMDPSRIEC